MKEYHFQHNLVKLGFLVVLASQAIINVNDNTIHRRKEYGRPCLVFNEVQIHSADNTLLHEHLK